MTSPWNDLAEDLEQIARLHHAELDAALLGLLRETAFPSGLALILTSAEGVQATELLRHATEDRTVTLDDLAADFAAIYLTNALRASPLESVWLDEDGLAMQGPMFSVREAYREQGFQAADWRQRPDDHLVIQLEFLAALLRRAKDADGLRAIALFLDGHTLLWVPWFARRAASRCATALYAGINLLTAAYLDELRDLIAETIQEPRPTPEEVEARRTRSGHAAADTTPYIPGVAPSW